MKITAHSVRHSSRAWHVEAQAALDAYHWGDHDILRIRLFHATRRGVTLGY